MPIIGGGGGGGGGSSPVLSFMWQLSADVVAIPDGTTIAFDTKVYGSTGITLPGGVFTVTGARVGVWSFYAYFGLFGGTPTLSEMSLQIVPAIEANIYAVQLAPYSTLGADFVASVAYPMKSGDLVQVKVAHDATAGHEPTLSQGAYIVGVRHGIIAA